MGKIGIVIGSVLVCGVLAVVGLTIVGGKKLNSMPVEEILANLASAADDMVGEKVASNIVVVGSSIEAGNRLVYIYRIEGSTRIDQTKLAKQTKKIYKATCRDRMMKRAMQAGATITFSYRNVKGNEVLAIDVTQRRCQA